MCIDKCENNGYPKQWKYVPLNTKEPDPFFIWKGMDSKESMVSLDYDRVFNAVREDTLLFDQCDYYTLINILN